MEDARCEMPDARARCQILRRNVLGKRQSHSAGVIRASPPVVVVEKITVVTCLHANSKLSWTACLIAAEKYGSLDGRLLVASPHQSFADQHRGLRS